MRTRFSVARCCCLPAPEPTCEITSDDFERTDSSDIDADSPCGWTEQSGSTLEIVSGEVKGTGTATCDTSKTSLPGTIKVTGMVRFLATNGQVRVIYQWTDADNYSCVEWVHLSSSLRGRIITRQSGSETVRATFELTHTRDSNEVFDFCVLWDSVSSPAWQVKSMIISQDDPTFALPGATSFTMSSPILAETGTAGFYLNGNGYLQSWGMWKTSLDSVLCSDCYVCYVGELYDDFSVSRIAYMPSLAPQWTGMWECYSPSLFSIVVIENGAMLTGDYGGFAWHCWKKDAFENFEALAQIELTDWAEFTSGYPTDNWAMFYLVNLTFVTNPTVSYTIGMEARWVYIGSFTWELRWCPFYGYNRSEWTSTETLVEAGDVAKITLKRTTSVDEYEIKWYVNNTLIQSVTETIDQFDFVTASNVSVYSNVSSTWDNFYFLSNATV